MKTYMSFLDREDQLVWLFIKLKLFQLFLNEIIFWIPNQYRWNIDLIFYQFFLYIKNILVWRPQFPPLNGLYMMDIKYKNSFYLGYKQSRKNHAFDF